MSSIMQNRLDRFEKAVKPYIEAPEGIPNIVYMYMRHFVEKNQNLSPDVYRESLVSEMKQLKAGIGSSKDPELLETVATILAMI